MIHTYDLDTNTVVGMGSPASGTGGQMEGYAILSWLSVNASLSDLLRGQLR